MRVFIAVAVALAAMLPGAVRASDYLYTFTGVVSYAGNDDATDIYANKGDPIAFSLRVRDSFHHVSYTYSPTGSSAIGGPDYAAGTIFPVDRKVYIDPNLGYSNDFTPLETGYSPVYDYSASVSKDLATKSLSLDFQFERVIPASYPGCTDRCIDNITIIHRGGAQVSSDAFTSPDFREVGSFDLALGSTGYLGDVYHAYFGFGDIYEIDLSHLTVERLPDAVPEPDAWIMMIGGLGTVGFAMRRRRNVRATHASETAGHGALLITNDG